VPPVPVPCHHLQVHYRVTPWQRCYSAVADMRPHARLPLSTPQRHQLLAAGQPAGAGKGRPERRRCSYFNVSVVWYSHPHLGHFWKPSICHGSRAGTQCVFNLRACPQEDHDVAGVDGLHSHCWSYHGLPLCHRCVLVTVSIHLSVC